MSSSASGKWGIWCLATSTWMEDNTGHPNWERFDCRYPTRAAALADLKECVLKQHLKDYEARKYRRVE